MSFCVAYESGKNRQVKVMYSIVQNSNKETDLSKTDMSLFQMSSYVEILDFCAEPIWSH